jgi:phage terminase large subunit
MIDWELHPQYKDHAWDGTVNPIKLMFESLAENKWVAVEGATGTSKTFFAACIVLWFLECFENSLVFTTAPREKQLTLNIWKEVGKRFPAFGRGKLTKLQLQMIQDSNEWAAHGFVSGVGAEEESATKAQGEHAEHMLFIFEEMPGCPGPSITAIMNTCSAPHNLILGLGNPDHQLDELHKFSQLKRVVPITISAFDHPNIVLKDPGYMPGAQSEQGLIDMLDRYKSKDNPMYLSRARGISPKQAREALIRYEWILRAVERRKAFEDAEGRLKIEEVPGMKTRGVDVANSEDGDKAAIARGKGVVLIEVEDFPCPNANKLGEQVFNEMKSEGVAASYVGVDGVGVGAGTVNELKRLGADVVDIQSAESAIDLYDREQADTPEQPNASKKETVKLVEQFDNLRSQMWWQLRIDLEDKNSDVCLPYDESLFADLMTPKWTTRSGKIVVQSKNEIRKKLGRSPNKGDAVVYWNWVRTLRKTIAAASGVQVRGDGEQEQPVEENKPPRYEPKFRSRHKRSF